MGIILVTDDDKTCRDSIQKILEREGHIVEGVADVDHALEAMARSDFGLVVCDCRMPGKSGLDFLAELQRKNSTIPVLMISAYADLETEDAARRLGAKGLLRKPFRRQELVENALRFVQPPVVRDL